MENYEEIKASWRKESGAPTNTANDILQIQQKLSQIKRGQKIGNWGMTITVLVLLGYLMYALRFGKTLLNFGLILMASVLVIRIIIEVMDKRQLATLDPTVNAQTFASALLGYYQRRKRLHTIITPILYLLYCVGFVLLLPTFKVVFSTGFFLYLVCSGALSLIVLAGIIYRQTQRELFELKSLR